MMLKTSWTPKFAHDKTLLKDLQYSLMCVCVCVYGAVPSDFDGEPNWVPVHARLLSLPELTFRLAYLTLKARTLLGRSATHRASHPARFCLLATSGCALLAYVGLRVNGTILLYLLLLVLLVSDLW